MLNRHVAAIAAMILLVVGVITAGILLTHGTPEPHQEPTTVATPKDAPPASIKPSEPAQKPTDPASKAKELYATYGVEYYGPEVTEQILTGICASMDTTTPGGAWRMQVEAYTDPDTAAANVLIATEAYCPEHLPAVQDWVDTMSELSDLTNE